MKKLLALLLLSPLIFSENNMIPLGEYIDKNVDITGVTARDMIYVNYRCIALNLVLMELMTSDLEKPKEDAKNNIINFLNGGFNLYSQIFEDKISDDPWQDYLNSVASQTLSMKESYRFQTSKDWQDTGNVLGGKFIKNDFSECTYWKELLDDNK